MQRRTASAAWRSVSPSIVLHDQDERQAPGRHLHRTPLGRIEIGKELIMVEGVDLGTELHIEVALGKGALYRGHRRLRNRW
jgi:hypothetical protein